MIKFRLFGLGEAPQIGPTHSPPKEGGPDGGEAPVASNGKKVLIVDDDLVFLNATATKLRTVGYEVLKARESAEAIAALGDTTVDAVLLDVIFPPDVCNGGMGSWDGFQLMYWLRGMPTTKGARFIMVSSSASPANRERASKLGAVAYLQKPLDPNQLIAAVAGNN